MISKLDPQRLSWEASALTAHAADARRPSSGQTFAATPQSVPAPPPAPGVLAPEPALTPEQASLVAAHMMRKVPEGLLQYFDLYLYVSEAAEGSWAQHLYVFHKSDAGDLVYEESFPVSTGREQQEKYFTSTPTGLFELDPDRFEPMHISHRWNRARMPWSMFWKYQVGDRLAGIALHAAVGSGELADLGHRASGGCVRMPLDRADALYHRILADEEGDVPVFAFNEVRNTTDVSGEIETDATGQDVLAPGYKVLLVVDTYPGPAGSPLVSRNFLGNRGRNRLAQLDVNRDTGPEWDKSACFG